MKKIFAIISAVFLITSFNARADIQVGLGLMTGQLSADGTEKDLVTTDTSTRSKSFDEFFVGADIFLEHVSDNGFTVGLSYVPVDFSIGDGKRTDSQVATSAGGAENDTGSRSASADVSDLISLYTNIPLGSSGWYGLLGGNMATIETSETLPTATYDDEDIFGYTVGIGRRDGKVKAELSYTDFEDIDVSGVGSDHSISADADATTFRISIGF